MSKLEMWYPFMVISLALCIGTLGTALASPLYPIYQTTWHLMPSAITYIFIAYMLGCLTTILFLGRTSNSIGFLRTLQIGLAFIIVGLILSAWAINAHWLGIGRFIIGIASGLITTSALLGLLATIPDQYKADAPQISSIVTVFGFALGPLVGGVIGQFAQYPLFTPYIPIIVCAILSLILLFSIKQPEYQQQPFSMAPHLELPSANYHRQFMVVGLAAFGIFAVFSLFASLAASFVKDVLPWHGPAVSGGSIAAILFISALVQFVVRQWDAIKNIKCGLSCMVISLVLLSICMLKTWSILFFVSVIFVGIGHGMGLLGAFALVHHMTSLTNRAAVVSTYLFMGYLGTIIPIVAVGYGADHFGLIRAVSAFCVLMAVFNVLLFMWQKKLKVVKF